MRVTGSTQHTITLAALTALHHRHGRPVLEHEVADELDVLLTGDELPPPVGLVLDDLRRAGLTVPDASGWVPRRTSPGPTALRDRRGAPVDSHAYVEEDEEAQGPAAPLQGQPRQAPQHGARLTRPHRR